MSRLIRLYLALWLLMGAGVAFAQNPQSTLAPIVSVNSAYNNGVSPGYRPRAGSGLVLNVGPGTANCSGTIETYAGGTLSMTASVVNYVYLNTSASCVPAVKTSSFGTSDIPITMVHLRQPEPILVLLTVARFSIHQHLQPGSHV